MTKIPTWKAFLILFVCVLGLIFAMPNMLSEEQRASLPEWMRTVNLGLDLQGGSQLLLEVDMEAGLKDQMNSTVDSVRASLREARIGYTNISIRDDKVVFTLRDSSDISTADKALRRGNTGFDVTINSQGAGSIQMNSDTVAERKKEMMQQSIEMVRRRVDEYGTAEPNIQQQGDDSILVQLPGVDDPARVRELLGKTAKMTFHFVHDQSDRLIAENRIPGGHMKVEGDDLRPFYIISKQVILGGEHLVGASPGFDDFGKPSVNFRFNSFGARKFSDITRSNVGRSLAIILDKKVISAPRINGQIPSGSGTITGSFTVREANDLALLMRAGALPAPLKVIEERTVGPDLGADSIAAGETATVFSIILVAVFMLLVYSMFGVMADIAVFFNIVLLVAFLSFSQATLTLPGIAGIALTIGMAVDANVLIYERIKEEIRNGQAMMAAVDAGYTRAMATIIDSNLTTLIGGILLYVFGTGAIKGFAVTLSVGIVISMFTAISLTRLIAVSYLRWRKPKTLPI